MVTVRFENKVEHQSSRLIEAAYFRITPQCLFQDAKDLPFAELQDGLWEADGKLFAALEIASPVKIHFEDGAGRRSLTHGPFEHVKVVDGVIWQRPGRNELLAWVRDDAGAWRVYPEQRDWLSAIVTAA